MRKGILEQRLERSIPRKDGAPLTAVGQLYDKAKELYDKKEKGKEKAKKWEYRWWRVTLNQALLRELRDLADHTATRRAPDALTAEVTSFLSIARQSNWMVINQLTAAFNKAAKFFGIQLLLWIVAAAALYLHLHLHLHGQWRYV